MGKLVEWVEKASFDRLNMLFEIAAVERSYETLLSTQNLRSVTLGAPAVRAKHTPKVTTQRGGGWGAFSS